MHRFLAFTWHCENSQAADRARHFMRRLQEILPDARQVMNRQGCVVYCASDSSASFDVYRGTSESALVVGKLFHREMNEDERPTRVVLDESTTQALIKSRGRLLLERYWGGYVAFICDESSRSTFVVRDPTGDLPCYITSMDGFSIIFSCMEDCIALGVRNFSTNWRYVSAFLVRPYVDVRETGLNEVSVLAPGECLEVRLGVERNRTYYWNIVDIATEDPIEDVELAVQSARRTLRACIGAWAADHPQIIHRLSGGLDSSIVLAGLLRAPSKPDVTCVHHFDHTPDADERSFARMTVEGASALSGRPCKLLEYRRSPLGFRLDQLATFPRTACPTRYVGYLSERYIGPESTANGRAIQFTGNGGDGTFVRLRNDAAAVDYVWRHGLGRHLPRVALEAAQDQGTFYGVLAHAIRDGLLVRKRTYHLGKQYNMIEPGVIEAVRADTTNHLMPAWKHAAPTAANRLSAEKLRHIDVMTQSWKTMDPYERVGRWEWFAPIHSQPVVELFARIPLYVLMDGAQDRTIARRAFAPDLPEKVLARRTKSYFDDFNVNVARHHATFLREMFLDGILVKEGLLDRRKVEDTLSRLHIDTDNIIRKLLGPQLNMETWLRNWRRGGQVLSQATAA